MALGRIPDRQGLSALQGLLVDDVPAVRRAAAFSIGLLGDPEAEQALFAAARDKDRETGVLAVEALGRLKARAVDVLEALLPLPEEERWARLLPASLPLQGGDRGVARRARPRGGSGPGAPRRRRLRPGARAQGRRPCPPCASCWPIPRRGSVPGPPALSGSWAAARTCALLRPLLDDRDPADPGPPIQALRSARAMLDGGKAKPIADWTPRLRALLDDPRPGVRASAIEAAGVWGSPELDDRAGGAGAGGRRRPGSGGRRWWPSPRAKHPKALELVTAAAADKDDALRTRAAEAAGALGLPAAARARAAGRRSHPAGAGRRPLRLAGGQGHRPQGPTRRRRAARKALDRSRSHRARHRPRLAGGASGGAARRPRRRPAGGLPGSDAEEGLAAVRAVAARAEGEPLERGDGVALLEKLADGGPLRAAAGRPARAWASSARPVAAPGAGGEGQGRSTSTARSSSAPASRGRSRSAPGGGRSPCGSPARRRR